jgi:hypothetical protein
MSEDRVLRRILGPMRQEVAGGWTRIHNKQLQKLHSSTNIKGQI